LVRFASVLMSESVLNNRAEGDVDLLGSDEYWDPHAIAGLLKTFLRELPASILTRDLHLKFLSVIGWCCSCEGPYEVLNQTFSDFVDPQERIKELSQLIASLPIANYSLLRALTAHLILIVQNAGVNKMTMRNVGIVFSPTLGIPAGVFSLMLGEFNRVFNVDAENGLKNSDAAPSPELSRRNSRQYSDAAADQLLGLSGRSLAGALSWIMLGFRLLMTCWLFQSNLLKKFNLMGTITQSKTKVGPKPPKAMAPWNLLVDQALASGPSIGILS